MTRGFPPGTRRGELVVLQRAVRPAQVRRKSAWWSCRCVCGREVAVSREYLETAPNPNTAKNKQTPEEFLAWALRFARTTLVRLGAA